MLKKNKKKVNVNWKFVLYIIRVLSMILFLILLLFFIPNIFHSGWQGFLFLILSLVLIAISVYAFLTKHNQVLEWFSYNILYIGMVCYFVLIAFRLLFDPRVRLTMIYELDMNYFKMNYLILSFIILGIILYTLLLILEDRKSVK